MKSLVFLSLVLSPTLMWFNGDQQQVVAPDASGLYERAVKAVVVIVVQKPSGSGLGSGVIVRPDGVIATNFHVIKDATTAQVQLKNGDIYDEIAILDVDERKDIALIKIKAAKLPVLEFADSDALKPGQPIYALGAPRGLEGSISPGMVSAIRAGADISTEFSGFRVIQFTAPISPGSSGGPLLDPEGKIVGLAFSSHVSAQNVNLGVPSNYVSALVANLSGQQRWLAKAPANVQPQNAPAAEKKPAAIVSRSTRSISEIVGSAKSLCIVQQSGNPTLKTEIHSKLASWEKLTLVSLPEEADLLFVITQTGDLQQGVPTSAVSAAGLLIDPQTSQELWSVSKGGFWAISGWSVSKVGRQMADDLIKFINSKTPKK
jgi:hypothetical protein